MLFSIFSGLTKMPVRFACPSKSTSKTFFPWHAMATPTLAVEVVFPTPPLWLQNAIVLITIKTLYPESEIQALLTGNYRTPIIDGTVSQGEGTAS